MSKVTGNPDANRSDGATFGSGNDGTQISSWKGPYSPPRVVSSELLEATANICDGTAGFGKQQPPIGDCASSGS